MQNEVFPTEFIKKKNEIYGSNKVTEKAFTGMKTYKGDEIKPYMSEKVADTIGNENIAKYHFDNSNHRHQFNQSVILISNNSSFYQAIEVCKKKK